MSSTNMSNEETLNNVEIIDEMENDGKEEEKADDGEMLIPCLVSPRLPYIGMAVMGEEAEKRAKIFNDQGNRRGWIKIEPGGWTMPERFSQFAEKIYNFRFHETDTIVMTFMKCGTTWMQELVWLMMNHCDFIAAKNKAISVRSPFLEYDMHRTNDIKMPRERINKFHLLFPHRQPEDGVTLSLCEAERDPRTIKTHLPFSLLSPDMLDTCKVVYVVRNPKDVCVSYFYHLKKQKSYAFEGDFEQFAQLFMKDELVYSPFWQHVKEAWEKKSHKNLLWVTYEDMKEDIVRELRRLNEFLGTNLAEKQLKKIASFANFDNMKTRNQMGGATLDTDIRSQIAFLGRKSAEEGSMRESGFFRKGITGDWKNHFTEELSAQMDEWIERNTRDMGCSFTYDIDI